MINSSNFDKNVFIDEANWAVTVYCNSECSGKPATGVSGDHHALIAIEGVEKTGEVFRQLVHLKGPGPTDPLNKNGSVFIGCSCYCFHGRLGEVEIKEKKHGYRFTHKSETWIRPADQVLAMRKDIEIERDRPSEHPRPFSWLGNKSIFARDLETFKIKDPLVLAIAHCNTDLFKTLYKRVKNVQEQDAWKDHLYPGEVAGIERLNYCYFYPRSILGDSVFINIDIVHSELQNASYEEKEHEFSFSNFLNSLTFDVNYESPYRWRNILRNEKYDGLRGCKKLYDIMNLFAQTRTSEEREKLVESACATEKDFYSLAKKRIEETLEKYRKEVLQIIDWKKLADDLQLAQNYNSIKDRVSALFKLFDVDPLQAYRDLLYLIYKNTDLCLITPDSCFTWVREKLAKINIDLGEKGIDTIVTPTKCYLDAVFERKFCCITDYAKSLDPPKK